MSQLANGATVLLYVVDAAERETLRARLQGHGAHVEEIGSVNEIGHLLRQHPQAISFVEVVAGDGTGLAITRGLSAEDDPGDIVVLSSVQDLTCRSDARDAGATDYLSMPVRDIDLEMRLARLTGFKGADVEISFDDDPTPDPDVDSESRLEALESALALARDALRRALQSAPMPAPSISGTERTSDVDALTGLLGAGPLQEYLDREYSRAQRYGHALSVLVIDVDHMARYNDRHGSGAGDFALGYIADVLRSALRSPDIVTRPGGDSFAILATDTTEDQALALGNRLREVLASEFESASTPDVTVSIGIASAHRLSVSRAADLLDAAERATGAAKNAGRDRCCVATEV